MKIKLEDLESLFNYINLQSVYITDDYSVEMEDEMGKKEVKQYDKLFTKISKKIKLEKQKIKD
jgi:endonuclease III-like uncharacterized protein|tara:strand:+ start:493 stop:681 length:189 start_codon:yes stop_codon:yes gene_type:complete